MLHAGARNFQRQVHQNRAEAHGQQQGGFHFLGNGQVNENTTDGPHHHMLQLNIGQVLI